VNLFWSNGLSFVWMEWAKLPIFLIITNYSFYIDKWQKLIVKLFLLRFQSINQSPKQKKQLANMFNNARVYMCSNFQNICKRWKFYIITPQWSHSNYELVVAKEKFQKRQRNYLSIPTKLLDLTSMQVH
jgi:hypothetical protein